MFISSAFFSSTIVPLLVYIARKKWGSAKEDSISSGRLMCNVHASLCVATNYAFMKAHCARQLPRFWHWNVSNVMHPYSRMWLVASKISRFTFVCIFDFVFIHFCDAMSLENWLVYHIVSYRWSSETMILPTSVVDLFNNCLIIMSSTTTQLNFIHNFQKCCEYNIQFSSCW